MLKKLVYILSVLAIAGTASTSASAENLTPLQRKVREVFAKMNETSTIEVKAQLAPEEEIKAYKANVEKKVEEESSTMEKAHVVDAMAAQDSEYGNVILASDQEESVSSCSEDDEFVVVHAPIKKNRVVKTASEVSEERRTAKVGKKWNITALGWESKLTGHVKIAEDKDHPETGEIIDLEKDTRGIDKETVPGVKVEYKATNRSSFCFNWVKADQDGYINVSKNFKGKNYQADANFEINNSMFDLAWNYRLAHNVEACGREKSYVSAMLGVKASDMEFRLSGKDEFNNTISEDYSKTLPVPYIGLEFGSYLNDNMYFKGLVRYLKLDDIKDYDIKHCDYDVALSYKLNGKNCDKDLFIDVGYRQIVFDVDGEGNDVELKYKGPYVGLEFLF